MARFFAPVLFLLFLLVAPTLELSAAGEPECIRYVPSVGKTVRVPCEEGATTPPAAPAAAAPPAASPPPAAPATDAATRPASPAPADDAKKPLITIEASPGIIAIEPVPSAEGAYQIGEFTKGELELQEKVEARLIEYTQVLAEVKADSGFRDTYCQTKYLAELARAEDGEREKERLWKKVEVLEDQMGSRGGKLSLIRDAGMAQLLLTERVDVNNSRKRMRHTPIGIAFIKARNELMDMSCQCMRTAAKADDAVCCDRCDQKTLQTRFNEKFSSR